MISGFSSFLFTKISRIASKIKYLIKKDEFSVFTFFLSGTVQNNLETSEVCKSKHFSSTASLLGVGVLLQLCNLNAIFY